MEVLCAYVRQTELMENITSQLKVPDVPVPEDSVKSASDPSEPETKMNTRWDEQTNPTYPFLFSFGGFESMMKPGD